MTALPRVFGSVVGIAQPDDEHAVATASATASLDLLSKVQIGENQRLVIASVSIVEPVAVDSPLDLLNLFPRTFPRPSSRAVVVTARLESKPPTAAPAETGA